MPELNDTQRQAVEAAIFAGHKIEAIKLYREAVLGSGLADAKKWVEGREVELRSQHPEKFTAPAMKSSGAGCALVFGVVLAAIIVWAILWR